MSSTIDSKGLEERAVTSDFSIISQLFNAEHCQPSYPRPGVPAGLAVVSVSTAVKFQ